MRREADPDDARGTYTVLTDAGFDRLRAAAPVHLAGIQQHWLSHFTDDELRPARRAARPDRPGVRPGSGPAESAGPDSDGSAAGRRAAVRNSLGVGLAVGTYGFAFGAASVAAGLSVLQTCLLSLLAFTGGTQFAVVGVIAGGGTVAAALGSGLLLGARNTLYAMRLAPLLRVRGSRRLVAALGTIDESTAMAIAQPS